MNITTHDYIVSKQINTIHKSTTVSVHSQMNITTHDYIVSKQINTIHKSTQFSPLPVSMVLFIFQLQVDVITKFGI